MMKADPRFIISIYSAVKMINPKFENIHDGESKLQLECILTFYTMHFEPVYLLCTYNIMILGIKFKFFNPSLKRL